MAGQNQTRKKAMLSALEKSLGIVTDACKVAKVARSTHYEWMNTDEEYKAEVENIDSVALDFAESCLFEQMKNGSAASIIFYLKTKGRGRGYIERQNIDHTSKDDKIQGLTVEIIDTSTTIHDN